MKNLILTEKHKEMLLEMSKTLFPEFEKIELETEPQYDGSDGFMQLTIDLNNNLEFANIYWYEFVHTELVEKILNPTPEIPCRNIANKFKDFFWESNCYWSEQNKESVLDEEEAISYQHPIEYLYKIFKNN